MILYNVTINIDEDVHDEWLQWMKEVHVPDVMRTGLFIENKICRLLSTEEQGVTYSFQYLCKSMNEYTSYQSTHAPKLQEDVKKKYAGKFVAFRSLLEVLE
jgi:Domain of unknown function (DUF4286)